MEGKLWLLLISMCISNFIFTSGLVYGFPGLQSLLRSEGIYHSLCTDDEWKLNDNKCPAEKAKFDLIFNLAANGATLASAQWGLTMERFGPRANSLVGHLILTLGLFLLAFSNDTTFDAFIPSLVFISWGGMANFMMSFQFAFLFPSPVLIRTLLTSLYTASGILFTIVDMFFEPDSNVISRRPIFIFWGILAAINTFFILALYPSRPYGPGDKCAFPIMALFSDSKYEPLDQYLSDANHIQNGDSSTTSAPGSSNAHSLSDNLLDGNHMTPSPLHVDVHSVGTVNSFAENDSSNGREKDEFSSPSILVSDASKYSSPQWDTIKANRTFVENLKDPGTTFITLFFTVGLLFMNLYLGNIGQILQDKGDSDSVYSKVFQFMFSFFPIVFSPGYTAIYNKFKYSGVILMDVIAMSLCWIPLFVDNLPIQILSFLIYAFARCFLVTVLFGYLSTQYRPDHYGYLAACATLVTGIIGVPAQLGMQDAIDAVGDDNLKYMYIAFIAGTTPFIGFAVWLRMRRW